MRDPRRPRTIRVRVDRQCEVPGLKGDESLEDVTVATEITSFAREEDAYVLQGYIEVAGYAWGSGEGWAGDWDRPQGFWPDAVSRHSGATRVEQRLAYELRVRAGDQDGEILHVKTRLGSWDVHVLGPELLHLRADLIVEGLSSSGYYFRCGDQEEGSWPPETPAAGAVPATRGGAEPSGDGDAGDGRGREPAEDDRLPSFDFEAGGEPWPAVSGSGAPVSGAGRPEDREDEREGDGAGFPGVEPESPERTSGEPAPSEAEGTAEAGRGGEEEEAAPGPTSGGESAVRAGVPEASPSEEGGEKPEGSDRGEPEEERGAPAAVRAAQERPGVFAWSKLYGQAGDVHRSTVTCRRVQEEDSLRRIADEYRISVSDLMRMNGLSQDVVHPGQWLLVPRRLRD